jgi:hypothetical protein
MDTLYYSRSNSKGKLELILASGADAIVLEEKDKVHHCYPESKKRSDVEALGWQIWMPSFRYLAQARSP